MEALVACFVELAATQFPQAKGGGAPPDGWPFPAAIKRRLQALRLVPVPTAPLEVDPSGAYDGVPAMAELGARLGHAGGINAPKVLTATDSAGRSHRMLVKSGNDDLRQVSGQCLCVFCVCLCVFLFVPLYMFVDARGGAWRCSEEGREAAARRHKTAARPFNPTRSNQ